VTRKLEIWATEKLEELKFLHRMVDGTSQDLEDDGFAPGDGDRLKGLVIWAPFHLPPPLFKLYLRIARETLGEKAWARIVGFRQLLQATRTEAEMRALVESENWQQNILSLRTGREGKSHVFDIGVDTRGGGVWQVEVAADMVAAVRRLEREEGGERSVRFVLSTSNFLCRFHSVC
jgi:L-rhamnono-1,4-lactonase